MSNVGRFTPPTSVRLPRRQEPARAPRRRARVPLVSRRLALWTRMPSSPIRRPGDSGPSGQAVGGIERKVGSGSNHGRPGKITELQRRYRTMRRCPWADAVPTAVRTGGTAHERSRPTSTVRDTSAIQRQSASSRTAARSACCFEYRPTPAHGAAARGRTRRGWRQPIGGSVGDSLGSASVGTIQRL